MQCFLTYADNNAVGYFAKQGFTKELTFDRERVSPQLLSETLYSRPYFVDWYKNQGSATSNTPYFCSTLRGEVLLYQDHDPHTKFCLVFREPYLVSDHPGPGIKSQYQYPVVLSAQDNTCAIQQPPHLSTHMN